MGGDATMTDGAGEHDGVLDFETRSFRYDPAGRGILHYIGTRCGRQEWVNPHDARLVQVAMSSVMKECQPSAFVAHQVAGDDRATGEGRAWLCTENIPYSWIEVALPVAVRPVAYQLSHGWYAKSHHLRNWSLLGCDSDTGNDWRILAEHSSDMQLRADGEVFSLRGAWLLHNPRTFFTRFRIVGRPEPYANSGRGRQGVNANNLVAAACFEIFGDIRSRSQAGTDL
eukprot:TRINITY_DN60838_c0_g1_i1.p1 TRINITY_DN60838_c0_g1~~TRINITY_DN60838_c0_g1_i1.p1  ORF type:complete len:250 (+),score=58.96 TRINITY_DN60838_c0_g1_i1:70-750(+)